MKGRLGKFGLIFLALALCLSISGAAFAMWDKTLYIDGTVKTGEVNADFDSASCNDTGIDPGYDKDVGNCTVTGVNTQTLTITVNNGYPCYSCAVNFNITNTGTIPVKIQNLTITNNPSPNVTVTWTGLAVGDQIDAGDELAGDIDIHVEQCAAENSTYTFNATIYLVQWNEFE